MQQAPSSISIGQQQGYMAADDDREHAVKEVAQVYERIKAHHPLLLLHCSPSQLLLAQSLLGDALRALNVALSVMKQLPPPPPGGGPAAPTMTPPRSVVVVKAEPQQLSPPSPAASADDFQAAVATTITARRAKKRRASAMMEQAGKTSSWVDFTTVPYDDGYEWRKYGEKKINGTSYTRSYFRCTYKDYTGCLATKHVQQKDNTSDDPPMFQVTYNHHHTCRSSKGAAAAAAAMNIKQEPLPAVLPPLVEAQYSALPFHQDQTLQCQQEAPFPIGKQQQRQQPSRCGIASTSSATASSCISGDESCDQYSDMLQMSAAQASAGDDFLYDLERFLLDRM